MNGHHILFLTPGAVYLLTRKGPSWKSHSLRKMLKAGPVTKGFKIFNPKSCLNLVKSFYVILVKGEEIKKRKLVAPHASSNVAATNDSLLMNLYLEFLSQFHRGVFVLLF